MPTPVALRAHGLPRRVAGRGIGRGVDAKHVGLSRGSPFTRKIRGGMGNADANDRAHKATRPA